MDTEIAGVLYLKAPRAAATPLVFDSPHSGTVAPDDFNTVAPGRALRNSRDSFVDDLFGDAPEYGAHLLAALFPRAYIDPNRALCDMDARLLDAPWPGPITPGEKTRFGHGLIWRVCPPNHDMYDRKLSVDEVRRRIEAYWRPYHAHLRDVIYATQRHFGQVWHINCHSMPASSAPVDFVLGDRDGATCAPAFTDWVSQRLRDMGYSVRVNDPYRGVELVRAYADPAAGRHSLQIEINRALYLDEARCERTGGFDPLRANLGRLMAGMRDFAVRAIADRATVVRTQTVP